MKQLFQDLKTGEVSLERVSAPSPKKNHLVIATRKTLVSVGTERMLVEFGRAGWINKARSQPDKVKEVIAKVKTDGLGPTIEAVTSKLSQPMPLGYCNVGIVHDGGGSGFSPGTRVVSNGPHAEMVRVSKNLAAAIPDNVSDEQAAFTVVGSIALQGIRLINPTIGETIVVTGLGLIGLLAVQILVANGCNVIGVDLDNQKCDLAEGFGATVIRIGNGEDAVAAVSSLTNGVGADAVLITASTKSNIPISQAANQCRTRGRVVLVGVIGLELNRADFYEKEISFQVSCSYGPGRYDPFYEDEANDYPIGYVRWTEQRNFEAVLGLMSKGQISVSRLISHRFEFDCAPSAYEMLVETKDALGVILNHGSEVESRTNRTVMLSDSADTKTTSRVRLGVIGAGNYASRTLIPAFKSSQAELEVIATSSGASGVFHGRKAGFRLATTDVSELIGSENVNTVVIATRHDTHYKLVSEALDHRKHVFVEKPLALQTSEVDSIASMMQAFTPADRPSLMVGFNRRFSPHTLKMCELLAKERDPKAIVITVNAGSIPADHWVQTTEGGGRIIGEGCHFVDLARHLANSRIKDSNIVSIGGSADGITNDKVLITLTFEDGSIASINYLANGASSFPKERVEVFCGGKVLQNDNFRTLRGYGFKSFSKFKSGSQDKGQKECVARFVRHLNGTAAAPIPLDELIEVSRVIIELSDSLSSGTDAK